MLRKEVKLIALDYDGVICDSQLECLAVGFNAYRKSRKTTLFGNKEFTCNNFNALIDKNKKIIGRYKSLRPFVIDAFCFYVILHIIDKEIKVENQDEYNEIRNGVIDTYDNFVKKFYEERAVLQEKNFEGWLSFARPYPIIKDLRKLSKYFTLAVATNNRESAIRGFLERYKIPVKAVADSTMGIDKAKQIAFLKDKYKADYNGIFFVDDQVSHFPSLMKLGVRCFLATWGYNNKGQKEYARKIGAVLVAESGFYGEMRKK